mgnify:CR=1 FL=1
MEGGITKTYDNWWDTLSPLRHVLYGIFFFFMPFTQAFTFDVGFPLKLSELALFLLAFLLLVFKRKAYLPRPIILILSALFFVITISVAVNLFYSYPYTLKVYDSRFGYNGDSIARYIYFILALMSFFVSLNIFLERNGYYMRYWLLGAIIAASYSWYLSIFSALKLPVFLLPGMKDPPQMIMGSIIRSGTFLEGNMMGLFLLVSAGMAFYCKRKYIAIFLLISVFTSFSTLSIVGIFLFISIYLLRWFLHPRYFSYLFLLAIVSIPFLFAFSTTEIYKVYIYDKLFANKELTSSKAIANEAVYSKADRLVLLKTASYTAADNPLLGVGLSNFALHYDHYLEGIHMDKTLRKSLSRVNQKPIPNNIYAEIGAESGLLALVLFLLFLGYILYYSNFDKTMALPALMVCLFLCFNAYPSFILIYLWSFMALPVSNYIKFRMKNL